MQLLGRKTHLVHNLKKYFSFWKLKILNYNIKHHACSSNVDFYQDSNGMF